MTHILNNLPLSELLRVAVADMRQAIRNPDVRLNMNHWVQPEIVVEQGQIHRVCSVCMAGSVLYCKLEERKHRRTLPAFADRLNGMRIGHLPERKAPRVLLKQITGVVRSNFYEIIRVKGGFRYDLNKGRAPLKTYLEAATYLESQGL
jgi:hypothetical protein